MIAHTSGAFFSPNASKNVNEEIAMNRFIHYLRARATAQALAGTTFCEDCGEICTPECRREALIERGHTAGRPLPHLTPHGLR